MRQIKFRLWEFNEMLSWEELRTDGYLDNLLDALEADGRNKGDGILMQFTGLIDKNGKEIWEGDIVKTGEGVSLGTVVFKDCAFRVEPFVCNVLDLFDYVEVLGNIYEHGHLLK